MKQKNILLGIASIAVLFGGYSLGRCLGQKNVSANQKISPERVFKKEMQMYSHGKKVKEPDVIYFLHANKGKNK